MGIRINVEPHAPPLELHALHHEPSPHLHGHRRSTKPDQLRGAGEGGVHLHDKLSLLATQSSHHLFEECFAILFVELDTAAKGSSNQTQFISELTNLGPQRLISQSADRIIIRSGSPFLSLYWSMKSSTTCSPLGCFLAGWSAC